MSNSDSVHVDPAVAAAGIQQWEAADGALTQAVQARLSTISGLEAGSPWGADGAGAQFGADYPTTSGEVAQGIREASGRLTQIGQGAKTAIGNSLASDEEQAAPVQATDGQFTGQPAAGGGSGGGSAGGGGGSAGGGGGGGGGSTTSSASAFLSASGGGQGQARLVEETARVVPVGGPGEDAQLVRAEVLRADAVETQQGETERAEAHLVQTDQAEGQVVAAELVTDEDGGPRPSIVSALMPGSEPRPATW